MWKRYNEGRKGTDKGRGVEEEEETAFLFLFLILFFIFFTGCSGGCNTYTSPALIRINRNADSQAHADAAHSNAPQK